jgi:hypothetical protein
MSIGGRGLLKYGDIAIRGGLSSYSTMTAIFFWQLRPGVAIVVHNAAPSTMGSHERRMKHTDTTGRMSSGLEK